MASTAVYGRRVTAVILVNGSGGTGKKALKEVLQISASCWLQKPRRGFVTAGQVPFRLRTCMCML